MRPFIHEDFMLQSKPAQRLYHEYAENMPIFDFHCHLSPREIYDNRQFQDITEIWLEGDHYKWRLLRANGVEERYVTGDADHYDKFVKWAETLPESIGNPLYHWSHLELKRYFGIDAPLCPGTAQQIWRQSGRLLRSGSMNTRDLISRSAVKVVCTTDDPADDLSYHLKLKEDQTLPFRVLPTFRPDKAFLIGQNGFIEWAARLGTAAGREVTGYSSLCAALANRAEAFYAAGCLGSDHSFLSVPCASATEEQADAALVKALDGKPLSAEEVLQYRTCLLRMLGRLYHRLGFVMQLHLGVIRNNNTRMFACTGPDAGFDAIGNSTAAQSLAQLLDSLEQTKQLPKTVVYCMNPADYDMLATVCGCFQGSDCRGKIQFGAAWWYNDTQAGMIRQLTTVANTGLLGRFIGMLTDSRSFLSYARHEYFRRILCNLLGEWVERGEVPEDYALLGGMVQNICYYNAQGYFQSKA